MIRNYQGDWTDTDPYAHGYDEDCEDVCPMGVVVHSTDCHCMTCDAQLNADA